MEGPPDVNVLLERFGSEVPPHPGAPKEGSSAESRSIIARNKQRLNGFTQPGCRCPGGARLNSLCEPKWWPIAR
jgi:hypothetical protein